MALKFNVFTGTFDIVNASSGGSSGASTIVTGIYTGDGAPTQSITGIGFAPKRVDIYQRGMEHMYAIKTDKDSGANAWAVSPADFGTVYQDNMINSLDSDGFTVSGTGPVGGIYGNFNEFGIDYTYTAYSSGSGGSGSSGYQVPTGALNQGTFTWTTAPSVIVVDGVPHQQVQQDGTVMWTGTTTTVLTGCPYPTYDIFGADGSTTASTAPSVWYQDEVPSGSGTSFTLAHTPVSVVFLYLNGQYQVSGIDYTRTGTAITMTTAVLATDTLIATYS